MTKKDLELMEEQKSTLVDQDLLINLFNSLLFAV